MRPASGQPPDEQRGMQGSKYGGSRNPTRVERLLRDRELRKINRAFQQDEAGGNGGREAESSEHLPEDCGREVGGEPDEEIVDGSLAPVITTGQGGRRSGGRPMKQRLLVVANRLPVSAVRRGEDSWSLEISAGGLVSALLGKSALSVSKCSLGCMIGALYRSLVFCCCRCTLESLFFEENNDCRTRYCFCI